MRRWIGYLLGALALAAVAALVTIHLRREALALAFANDALAGSGFRVSDLSIARLRADEIRFRRLDLEAEDGTRYQLEDLVVPLALPETRIRAARIGRVRISPGGDGKPSADLPGLLDSAFGLPARLPGFDLTVGSVLRPGWPRLDDVAWRTAAGEQRLDVEAAGVAMTLSIAPAASGHRVTVAAGQGALDADLLLEPVANGYALRGSANFSLGPWLALARETGALPWPGLAAEGTARAELAGHTGTADGGQAAVTASIVLGTDNRLGFSDSVRGTAAEVRGLETLAVEATFPGAAWTLKTGPFQVQARHPAVAAATADVTELACEPTRCRVAGVAEATSLAAGAISTRAVAGTGRATLRFADDWSVELLPGTLTASAVTGDGWRIGRVHLRDGRDVAAHLGAAGARATAAAVTVELDEFEAAGAMSGSARLELEALAIDSAGPSLEAGYELPKDGLRLAWGGTAIAPLRLRGRIALRGDDGTLRIAAEDLSRGLDAEADLVIAPGRVRARLDHASLDFGAAPLSASLPRGGRPWDLAAGRASASGTLEWRTGSDATLAADLKVAIDDAAASWNDLVATGITADLPVHILHGRAPVLGPGTVRAAYLDVGLPLQNLEARLGWDMAGPVVSVAALTVNILGGTVQAAPFGFDVDALSGALTLEVDGIQLGLIPELQEFETVELTGSLSGTVPLDIEAGTVTVTNGHLENDPPGGVIRYHAPAAGQGSIAVAQRALSHLRYDSLTSDVNYTEAGDLVMKLRLEGTNPDMDPLQPIILNLNIENNVPRLLESLQAARDIQDVIERRTSEPRPALPQ